MNRPLISQAVEELSAYDRGVLRVLTCGSVDDGKSTLIGRLLYDLELVPTDQFETLKRDSSRAGTVGNDVDLALLLDGLEAEQEQGITIDVAYRFFHTARRAFVVADTPGHEQYTRNMATGASVSDAAILLIDARKGILPQTRRHSLIVSQFGIKHVALAVNKCDLIEWSETVFRRIIEDYSDFAGDLGFSKITAIPICARAGDNVVRPSANMPWFEGPTLLDWLESVDVASDRLERPFRFPLQWVCRPNADFRGLAGTVESGQVRRGDRIAVAGSGMQSTLARIVTMDGDREEAGPGDAVTLVLSDQIDASRGDLLCHADARPVIADQLAANLLWLSDAPMIPGRSFLMKIGTRTIPATVTTLKYRIDVNTGAHMAARTLGADEIGFCNLALATPLAIDPFTEHRGTGAFIIIDRFTNATVGAGMVAFALHRASNVYAQHLDVDKAARSAIKTHRPAVVWLTGLPGAGKSTIANIVERRLNASGRHTYLLDGDNVRGGLNRDLGFTEADRVENVRRVAELARLFVDAGLIVIVSLISPFHSERLMARERVGDGEFVEVFIDTPLAVCRQRDPKGLYAKADRGELQNFTGIDSPYEPPETPELHLSTVGSDPETLAEQVLDYLRRAGIIQD